jgi:ferredoxin
MQVVVSDDLCQPKVFFQLAQEQKLQPCVVGACSQLEHKSHFREEVKSLGADAYSIRIIDLLKEITPPLSASRRERTKLLLWAQIRRMREFKGIRQEKLKQQFFKPKGEISRRELLRLVLPRYEVIPFTEPEECRGYKGCRLCIDNCPLKAVKVEENEVVIDKTICNGCGACVAVCPHGAIAYPTFSLEELDKETEGLLFKDVTLESRIIAVTCQTCLPAIDQDAQFNYPDNLLPLKVPCLVTVSPWLVLRAFDMGAQGFALISGKCHSGFEATQWQDNIRFLQGLFKSWDIEPERIRVFEIEGEVSDDIKQELAEFAEEVARLGPTPLGVSAPTLLPAEGLLLPALLKGLVSKLGSPPQGVVSTGMVPFGKVVVDGSQCTGCGLCAFNCPTKALTVPSSEETGVFQLLFKHDACVACGRCVEVCPEKCLRLERRLELDKIDSPPVMLFEDRMVRCSQCGSLIGSRIMIDKIRAKVVTAGESLPSQFELCTSCKIKAQFSFSGDTPAHTTPNQGMDDGHIS